MICKRCHHDVDPINIPRPDTVHAGGELRCPRCDMHLGWRKVDKEHAKKRTHASQHSPQSLGIECCELCLRPKRGLGIRQTLEIHHKIEVEVGGPDKRSNIWVLCTPCHKLLHHMRIYHNEHLQHMWPEAEELVEEDPNAGFILAETEIPWN